MRHGRSGYKLKRDAGSRNSLLKNLVTSTITEERIVTTVPKAKAAQPLVEKMITLAKRDTLHARRQAAAFLETPAAVKKLFDKLGTSFVLVRKLGKLPYTTINVEYDLEYGTNTVEMHSDSLHPGQRVIIIDDLLATGGTAAAAARLVERLGAEVVGFGFVVELAFLEGRKALSPYEIRALLRYD